MRAKQYRGAESRKLGGLWASRDCTTNSIDPRHGLILGGMAPPNDLSMVKPIERLGPILERAPGPLLPLVVT